MNQGVLSFHGLQPPPMLHSPYTQLTVLFSEVPRANLTLGRTGVLVVAAENVATQTGLPKSDVSPCTEPNQPSLPPADPQNWGKEMTHRIASSEDREARPPPPHLHVSSLRDKDPGERPGEHAPTLKRHTHTHTHWTQAQTFTRN